MVILNDFVFKLVVIYSKENMQVTDIQMDSPNSNQLFQSSHGPLTSQVTHFSVISVLNW